MIALARPNHTASAKPTCQVGLTSMPTMNTVYMASEVSTMKRRPTRSDRNPANDGPMILPMPMPEMAISTLPSVEPHCSCRCAEFWDMMMTAMP